MPQTQKLSEVVNQVEETIRNNFERKTFWIKAEITDVKKIQSKNWCYLKFIEKDGETITTEMKGVFWSNSYYYIQNFENETQQQFANGLEITCNVRVKFHKRYGMSLEVLEIDFAYAIGKLERERKQILERLIKENPTIQLLENGYYATANNQAMLPMVIQNIALITAPNSDGQRDFCNTLLHNKYGYTFSVTQFLTTIQGDNASQLILNQLKLIEQGGKQFDVVVVVRGGGSDIDFKAFNDYELSKHVALFPVPILTGIGHDRNTSIVDLMARQHKTPTEAANFILDNNYNFEINIMHLKQRLSSRVQGLIGREKDELRHYRQRIKNLDPASIQKKGYAIVYCDDQIITDPKNIPTNAEIKTSLQDEFIYSTVTKKVTNGQ